MADANLLDTVNLYTMQQDDLTHQLSDIMESISRTNTKSFSLIQTTNDKRAAVRKQYEAGSAQYDAKMDEIDDQYKASLAEIQTWETELEVQKDQLEDKIKTISGYKESFQSALKQNVQNDYKFGGN